MISFRVLGGIELQGDGGQDLDAVLVGPKRLAVLTYLALGGSSLFHRRDTLLGLFWPDADQSRGRSALRNLLHALRAALGTDVLVSRGADEVGLDERRFQCDARAFRTALHQGDRRQAVALYRGELLPGFFLGDAPEFEAWLETERGYLRRTALDAALQVSAEAGARGSAADAVSAARRVLELDPHSEVALQQLMRVLEASGRAAEALRAYDEFAFRLLAELELSPSPATLELTAELRSRAARASRAATGGEPDARKCIAVLPFANLGGSSDDDYLGAGIAEEIMSALGRVSGLRVAARGGALSFGGDSGVLRERLHADAVLEGSVRRDGSALRITARLTDAHNGEQIWTRTYERQLRDLFVVQEHIAQAIVAAVHATLTGSAAEPLVRRHTQDLEAYNLYLKGRFHWNRRPRDIGKALDYLQQALVRDPGFALAHAGVADAYNTLGSWEAAALPPLEAFPKAHAAAIRALQLDPNLAEAHTPLGYASTHYLWDWHQAAKQFQRAITLNPGYSHARHWYSHYLMARGEVAESLEESRCALSLDPVDGIINVHMAWHHWLAHAYDESIEQCRRTAELDPHDHWVPFFMSMSLEQQGAFGEAVREQRRALELSGGSPVMLAALGHTYAAAGDHAEARTVLSHLEAMVSAKRIFAYEIAIIHGALGDADTAFDWLDQAYVQRSAWLAYLRLEPRLAPLRRDPRLATLMHAVGVLGNGAAGST